LATIDYGIQENENRYYMEDHTLRDTVADMQPGRTRQEDDVHSFSAGNGQEKTGIEGQPLSGMDPEQENSSAEKGAEAEKNDRREAGKSAFVEELISWIYSFIAMFIVALLLTQFVIINAVIPSGSMEDTIMTHDRLIGARFSYWFSEPERGDIVIFHYPVEEKKIYIKRVIGLPGETVRLVDGSIYIDDSEEPLQEGYLKEEWDVLNSGFEFHVPEGCYLMLGDNRNWSEDARYWADNALNEGLADTPEEAEQYTYVHKEKILGKAIFTYFRKFRILEHGGWYE
jgi:signal peptidase I